MNYIYTRSNDPQARGKAPNHLYKWTQAQDDIRSILTWAYLEGYAFSVGVFDLNSPLIGDEKTHRNVRLWKGSQLILLDIDNAPGTTIHDLVSDPFIRTHAAAVFPSSSYAPGTLKAHILVPLDQFVTDVHLYRSIGLHLTTLSRFPFDRATLNPAQPTYGTVFTDSTMQSHTKGLNDGLCWINPNVIPFNVDQVSKLDVVDIFNGLSKRVKAHESAKSEQQTGVIIDALAVILDPEWGELDREYRLQTIMSAYQGSNSPEVLNAFLAYSSPRWDTSSQKRSLPEWWEHHKPREGGLTVSTLFAQARAKGWLQISSVELQGATEIDEPDLTEWLTSLRLPTCLLLKSATGTGKTQAAIKLLKKLNPTRAVFFAPSIKLCHALSASLKQAGVENTLYIENNRKTKDKETLRSANVLVTTLQTFAVKAFAGDKSITYDLVVMDECDEMLSAFVRSGISRKIAQASHVDGIQARLGIDALEHLFKTSRHILMLDGTMTELSRFIATQWTKDVEVYDNVYQNVKAAITFYPTIQTIRDDIVEKARHGLRIVVACDTKAEAALIEHLLVLSDAATPDSIIRITGDTAADKRVPVFFRDVEQGAKDYQIVIYNSAMGSGVSITETQPDYIYLLSTYLSPRKLLQMLNRYRRQTEVRAFVQQRENLYQIAATERYATLQRAAKAEEMLIGVTRVQRSEVAQIITHAALLAATDEFEQTRSVRDFFIRLIQDEGRLIDFVHEETEIYLEVMSEVKDLLKSEKSEIRENWRSVAPIKRGDSFPEDISVSDAAKGLLHGYIDSLFSDTNVDLDDSEIARIAVSYGRYKNILRHLLNPDSIMKTALNELQDRRKESVAYRLYMARVELVTQLNRIFPDSSKDYTEKEIEDNALVFLSAVKEREAVYNLVAPTNAPYAELIGTPVKRATTVARTLLKSIGLGTTRRNGKRIGKTEKRERITGIRNLNDVITFVRLSGIGNPDRLFDFNHDQFTSYREALNAVIPVYNGLRRERQTEVVNTLNIVDASFLHTVRMHNDIVFA